MVKNHTNQVGSDAKQTFASSRDDSELKIKTALLESMIEGVSLSDETGIIVYTNPAEDKIFGYKTGELIGQHVSVQNIYSPKKNKRVVNEVIEHLKAKGFWHGEFSNKKKDGTPFTSFARITALEIYGKSHWMCVQEDITERKKVEENLNFRTALLEAQNEVTPDGILIVDTKGKILSYNERFSDMWNMPEQIITERDDAAALKFAMLQLVNPKEFIDRVNYLYSHPDKVSQEEIRLKDGRVFNRYGTPVKDSKDRYYGWAWYFHDITNRKVVEDRQMFLNKVSDALFASLEDEDTIQNIAQLILSYIADYCRIVTLDENNKIKDIAVTHTDPTKVQLVTELYDQYKDDKDSTQGVQRILKTGKAELVPVIDKKILDTIKDNPKLIQVIKDLGLRSYMGVPLTVHNKIIGAITFSSVKSNRTYNKEDLAFASELGRRIALALDNSRLYRETKKATQEAERERQRLSNLFNQAPAMISITKGRRHMYSYVNPLYLKIAGKTEDIIGKTVAEVFPEIKGQGIIEILDNVYKTGKPFVGDEVLIKLDVNNNGTVKDVYFNFVYHPSRGTDNKVDGILAHAVEVTSQVLARQQVEENEERFRLLIEKSSDVISLSDSQGNYSYVSPGVKKVLGYTPSEFTRMNGFEIMHPEELDYIGEKFQKLLSTPGKSITITLQARHKNGSWRRIEATATNLLDDPKIGAIVSNLRNITDRKQAEDNLQQQLDLTETIVNNASACLFMINHDGLVTFMNPAAIKVTGYKPKEAVGKSMHSLVHHSRPDGRVYPESECPLVKTYIHGEPNPLHEDIFFRKDGTPFPALISGKPIPGQSGIRGTVVEFRDISEEKQSREALFSSEKRLRFMAESMPQKIFTATPEGNIDYFNPQWMEYTGLSFDEIKNWGWKQFIHPDDLHRNIEAWQHSINTGKPFEFEHRFRNKYGEYRWHFSRAHAQRNSKGKITMWIGSNTDTEDVKRTNKRKDELEKITTSLTEQRKQLIELNEAKDEFISVASHQLRTPATGVKQYIGMMLEGYAGPIVPDQKALLHTAYESNERQLNIINDLLKVATIDAGKVVLHIEATDLIALVKSVIREQASKFSERSQAVIFKPKNKKILATVDSSKLRMVIENIIDNASKYSYEHKSIEIIIVKTKKFIKIVIKDEGVGIDKRDQERLFRKFSSIDNPLSAVAGGTGLGLYWANKIMELHGGNIEVSSDTSKGSVFTLKIPINKDS